MSAAAEHTDVVAYAFGALEEADRRAFEEHLATCASCTDELAGLREMKDLFTGLKEDTAVPPLPETLPEGAEDAGGGSDVVDLLRRRKSAARRQRRATVILSAAAAAAFLAGGIAIGGATASHKTVTAMPGMPGSSNGPAPQLVLTGERHSATDPASGVHATVALMSLGWGTHVALEIGNVKGPLECELVAISKTGTERVVGGWSVPPAGYGTPAHHDQLYVHGGTSIPRNQLARFEVRVIGGGTQVSIPV